MAIVPKFFIDAVVSIGNRNHTEIDWIGTGFFVIRKVDKEGNARPFLITNKHVFGNKKSVVIRMKEQDKNSLKEIDVPIVSAAGVHLYKLHPIESIDIAVLPLNGSFITENKLEFPAFDIDEHAMPVSELLEGGVNEGSLVYMIGFPMGLVIKDSQSPICRLGCIARLCEEQIKENHNILLDIQNFPGNSGSPIVSRPEIISIEGTPSLNKCTLIGIVHSYIPYQEQLINSQTKRVVEIRSENSGIANVHPVDYIREILDEIQAKYIIEEDISSQ